MFEFIVGFVLGFVVHMLFPGLWSAIKTRWDNRDKP